ncbi:hypothetical protein D9619_001413 [Psilocybe cf. subviscida]|uniref:Uncharacterized protein n=1 Tax=Psilocybe cf. subviscida TaxID=2480587 RepID=A0A8H5F2A5_9AGAR|nr:hypothetical protein D9619_001413 [Psilocybe cf. subviscida]
MSLARRAALRASRTKPVFTTVQTRAGSSSAHDDHHHEADTAQYPPESFATPFWRNVLLLSIGTVLAVKYAPEANEDAYLTRWIAMYKPSADTWLERNAMHTANQREKASETQLVQDAMKPAVHRFRYPQSMTQASPFVIGVGQDVDMASVVPKQNHDNAFASS